MEERHELIPISEKREVALRFFEPLKKDEVIELIEERNIVIRHPNGTTEQIDRRYTLARKKI